MRPLLAEYRIDELQVDTASPIGEGGAAVLYRCITPGGAAMVFKRYNEDALAQLDVEALRRLIEWPTTLRPEDRQRLLSICAWPQGLVVKGGSVIGLVIPEAPAKFFLQRKGKLEPCHFTRIAVRNEEAQKRGYPYFDFPHKIARLGHLLSDLEFLHSKNIVIGDLQPNNILTTAPQPDDTGTISTENYLVDCDSFIVDGRAAFPPMDPVSTRPPYTYDGFSATTDLFKFALLVIRCLSEHLAADAIHFDMYGQILPSADFEKLEKLLTSPAPGLNSADLASMARAWQLSVKPDGRMYRRTDTVNREPWTRAMRRAHLDGVKLPPRDAPSPSPKRSKPKLIPSERGPGKPYSRAGFGRQGWYVAAAVAALIPIIFAIAAITGGHGGGDSTTTPTNTTQTKDSAEPTTSGPVFDDSRSVIQSAKVGDCIHQTPGPDNPDGTHTVVVTRAKCGTTYATDRVVAVNHNATNCRGVQDGLSPPVVLCLVPD